jgi:hypothetical protein
VLVAGGVGNGIVTNAEIYNPVTATWTVTGSLKTARADHAATLLPNGKVVASGGTGIGLLPLSGVEIYDPATGTWSATGTMAVARRYHTATLLLNGKILVSAGLPSTNRAELYDVGLGFSISRQAQITFITPVLNLGASLDLNGSLLRGASEGSSGNAQDSPADYPIVQLRSMESARTVFPLTTNWSTNSFSSVPVTSFPPGYAMATIFVNGIPSTSSVFNVKVPIPAPPILTSSQKLTNGYLQFSFTNSTGATFGVLGATNLSLPLSNWTPLGGAVEVSPGNFQFIDSQAASKARQFYRVHAP